MGLQGNAEEKKTKSSDSKGGIIEDNKYETPVKVGINQKLIQNGLS